MRNVSDVRDAYIREVEAEDDSPDPAVLELLRSVLPGVDDELLEHSAWYRVAGGMIGAGNDLDPHDDLCTIRDILREAIAADGGGGTREKLRDLGCETLRAWCPPVNRYCLADMFLSGVPGDQTPSLDVFFGHEMGENIRSWGAVLGNLSYRLHEAGMDSNLGGQVEGSSPQNGD